MFYLHLLIIFKDMKSLFASLKYLQKAFDQSPYKSIDYFLEILLLAPNPGLKKPDKKRKLAEPTNPVSSPVKPVKIQIQNDGTSSNSDFCKLTANPISGQRPRKLPSSVTIKMHHDESTLSQGRFFR